MVLATPQGPLTIVTTHLSLSDQARTRTAGELLSFIRPLPGPLLLLGDLNSEPSSPALRLLVEGGLRDAFSPLPPHLRWTYTTLAPSPRKCIDFALGRLVHVLERRVLGEGEEEGQAGSGGWPSDHRPLWLQILFANHTSPHPLTGPPMTSTLT